jgi:hypothetical protein
MPIMLKEAIRNAVMVHGNLPDPAQFADLSPPTGAEDGTGAEEQGDLGKAWPAICRCHRPSCWD